MKKYKYIGTEEQLYDYLIKNYRMNENKEINLIEFVCYGFAYEISNTLQCDLYGDELDFTLKHDDERFEYQVEEIIQDLIDAKLVEAIEQ